MWWEITYTYMNKNKVEHIEQKPRLGARKPNPWVHMAKSSKDNRKARRVTETFRYRQCQGGYIFFSLLFT